MFYVTMQVKLGDRPLGYAGCLTYTEIGPLAPAETTGGRSLPLIVIVGTIGIAVIVLLTLVVLRAYMRHRRRLDEERRPLDHPKVCKAKQIKHFV